MFLDEKNNNKIQSGKRYFSPMTALSPKDFLIQSYFNIYHNKIT